MKSKSWTFNPRQASRRPSGALWNAPVVLLLCLLGSGAVATTVWSGDFEPNPDYGDFLSPRQSAVQEKTGPPPFWVKALLVYAYPVTALSAMGVPLALVSPTGMGSSLFFVLPVGFLLSFVILAVGRPWMKLAWSYLVTAELALFAVFSSGYFPGP